MAISTLSIFRFLGLPRTEQNQTTQRMVYLPSLSIGITYKNTSSRSMKIAVGVTSRFFVGDQPKNVETGL